MTHPLYEVLALLDEADIDYHLGRYDDDTVTVHVSVTGGRHEIEVDAEGTIRTTFFEGDEDEAVEGFDGVDEIIEQNTVD